MARATDDQNHKLSRGKLNINEDITAHKVRCHAEKICSGTDGGVAQDYRQRAGPNFSQIRAVFDVAELRTVRSWRDTT